MLTGETMYPIYQVDAFSSTVFGGNPAAVVPLDHWLDDEVLRSIAAENNLAETAYLVPAESTEQSRSHADWELRWFTPTAEVALCGHATLAAAHVLVKHLRFTGSSIVFHTRQSGTLVVECAEPGVFSMSFPAIAISTSGSLSAISNALGSPPESVWYGHYSADQFDYVAVYSSEQQVADLEPIMQNFKDVDSRGIIATSPGDSCDFVSRYFAPDFGIDEDPVTGSAHCLLTPYWSERLSKPALHARQISARGGELHCELTGDRVILKGSAVDYMKGEITF